MLKKKGYIFLFPALLVLALLVTGCHGGDGDYAYVDDDDVTFVNDYGEAIVIQPFGSTLYHGESVDIDIDNDIVHVVVFREFDGLVLLDTDVEGGDVWVIQ